MTAGHTPLSGIHASRIAVGSLSGKRRVAPAAKRYPDVLSVGGFAEDKEEWIGTATETVSHEMGKRNHTIGDYEMAIEYRTTFLSENRGLLPVQPQERRHGLPLARRVKRVTW